MNYFSLTANLIDACFIVLGKTGKILNARGNRICFILDLICLTYWFYMDINRGLYSQAVSCVISMAISVYGYRKWGQRQSTGDIK
jgi:nicotinamide riboside transporter PnuC